MIARQHLLLVSLLALAVGTAAEAVPFTAAVIDAAMSGDVKAIADFDGDGFLDVVVGGDTSVDMYWYRYPGWTKYRVAEARVEFTTDMQAGDVDGDGDADIIVPDGGSGGDLAWFENPRPASNPTGVTSWTRHAIDTVGYYAHDVDVGDVNNDGAPDVVTRGGAFMLWMQSTPTNWVSRDVGTEVGLTSGEGLGLGDVDGDGDLDLAAAGRWYEMPADPLNGTIRTRTIGSVSGSEIATLVADLNADGRPDVVMCPLHTGGEFAWYEAPTNVLSGAWTKHVIDNSSGSHKLSAADFNNDGLVDLALGLENIAPGGGEVVLWLNQGGATPTFSEQVVSGSPGAHNLRVGDIGNDHDMDLFGSGWIGQPPPATVWSNTTVSATNVPPAVALRRPAPNAVFHLGATVRLSAHAFDGNGSVAEVEFYSGTNKLGEDSLAPYFVGWGTTATGVVELMARATDNSGAIATSAAVQVTVEDGLLALDNWTYVQADSSRGNVDFGLAFGDVNGDGYLDIASGRYFYINPGGVMTDAWTRITLPGSSTLDANLVLDVDTNGRPDVIAQDLPNVYWLKPASALADSWSSTLIGTLPTTEHQNSQGYRTAQVVTGGLAEIVYAAGTVGGATAGLFYFRVPTNPAAGSWPKVQITADAVAEDGLAAGDIDSDGDDDVVAAYGGSGDQVAWWENPGDGSSNWLRHALGDTSGEWCDRINVGDLNNDNRLDVIVSVENGISSGAETYWFERPAVATNGNWTRRTIATQGSTNSKDVGDVDNDGDLDVVTGEHRGDLKVIVWENQTNAAGWAGHQVSLGRESHLGSRLADLDSDGDLDIVSIAYDAYQYLHIWRNDAVDLFAAPPGPPQLAVDPVALSTTGAVSNDAPARSLGVSNAGTGTIQYVITTNAGWMSVSPVGGSVAGESDTITVSFHSSDLPAGSYGGTITVTATNPGVLNATQAVSVTLNVVEPGSTLVAYWAFDEGAGSVADDSSGHGHTGTVVGAAWTAARIGGGLDFDGTDDRVTAGTLDIPGTCMTITAWIKADSLNGDIRFVSKATGTAEQDHYWMLSSYDDTDRLRFRLKTGGTTTTLIADTGKNLTNGNWIHIAAVYDGSAMMLYQDGALAGSTAKSGGLSSNDSVQAWIGANPPGAAEPFDGVMDEVRIYRVALTQEEIQDLIGDADADGLPDSWELSYCASLACFSPYGDADADHFIDSHERLAGTNPTNTSSLLRIVSCEPRPDEVIIRWSSVTNKSYRVVRASRLVDPDFTPIATNQAATPDENAYTNPASGEGPLFYRIQLE
ncbi:MAG: FG-GAP-like repeat-containing protein [Verrucomicrobiota bacterium]